MTKDVPFQKVSELHFLTSHSAVHPPGDFIAALKSFITKRKALGVPLQSLTISSISSEDEDWFGKHVPLINTDGRLPEKNYGLFHWSDEW